MSRVEEYVEKTVPVADDQIVISDSAATNVTTGYKILKKLKLSKLFEAFTINNLTSGGTTIPLSAEQGKTLKTLIDSKPIKTNYIINGDFQVDQYGLNGTGVVNGDYCIDRFKASTTSSATFVVSSYQNNVACGLNVTTGTSGVCTLSQIIESNIFNLLKGKTVTLDLEIVSDNANARVVLYDGVSYTNSAAIPIADGSTYNRISIQKTISGSASELRIFVGICGDNFANTSYVATDFFRVTRIQLKEESTASDFQSRLYSEELALCQRYAIKFSGSAVRERMIGYDAGALYFTLKTPVSMRTTPTIVSGTEGSANNFVVRSTSFVDDSGFTISVSGKNENYVFIQASKGAHVLTDGILQIGNNGLFLKAEL